MLSLRKHQFSTETARIMPQVELMAAEPVQCPVSLDALSLCCTRLSSVVLLQGLTDTGSALSQVELMATEPVQCPISLDTPPLCPLITPCGHVFGAPSLQQHLVGYGGTALRASAPCPLCNAPVVARELRLVKIRHIDPPKVCRAVFAFVVHLLRRRLLHSSTTGGMRQAAPRCALPAAQRGCSSAGAMAGEGTARGHATGAACLLRSVALRAAGSPSAAAREYLVTAD